jgi:catalase
MTFTLSKLAPATASLLVALAGAAPAAGQPVAPAAAPVSPVALVDQFEATGGKFGGYRRSRAKGICAMGEFVGSAEGKNISTASAFSGQKIAVIVRFSVGGGNARVR